MSGGGLMAGCASVVRQLDPTCEIVGVEPATADDTRRSFAAGQRIVIDPPDTIADGLAVTSPGAATFEINRLLVDDIVTVTDDELVEAMRAAFQLLGRTLEPSGAAGLAAVLVDPRRFADRRVGIVLSGGNIDDDRFTTMVSSS
jgi:threonine dehydratase